jgi:hypothetical protein
MSTQPIDTRSILNAVASVRAGQEQMQKDVDRLRAHSSALTTMLTYLLAIGLLGLLIYSKAKGTS